MRYIVRSYRGEEMVGERTYSEMVADNSCEALEIYRDTHPEESDCILTCEVEQNILEYIDSLMDEGYTEEDAEHMADIAYNVEWQSDEYDDGYDDGYDDYDYCEWADAQDEL